MYIPINFSKYSLMSSHSEDPSDLPNYPEILSVFDYLPIWVKFIYHNYSFIITTKSSIMPLIAIKPNKSMFSSMIPLYTIKRLFSSKY